RVRQRVLEGSGPTNTWIVKFQYKDAARAWFESADYQQRAPLRRNNTVGTLVLLTTTSRLRPGSFAQARPSTTEAGLRRAARATTRRGPDRRGQKARYRPMPA